MNRIDFQELCNATKPASDEVDKALEQLAKAIGVNANRLIVYVLDEDDLKEEY